MPRSSTLFLVLLVSLAAGCDPAVIQSRSPTTTPPVPGGRDPAVTRYSPPVTAPVIDPFRAPPGPFAAGNRGIEYETRPGTAVLTIAAGRVVFAGPVAGTQHVTVLHEDGLRSSYSYLATVGVDVGDPVRAGQGLGTATARLHLGVRAAGAYLDPGALFDRGAVHLVPTPSG